MHGFVSLADVSNILIYERATFIQCTINCPII